MIRYINAVLLICYGCSVLYLLLDIHIKDFSVKKRMLFITCLAILFSVNIWLITSSDVTFYGKYYIFFVQLPVLVLFSIVTRYKNTKLLFSMLTAIVMSSPAVQLPFIFKQLYNLGPYATFLIKIITYVTMIILIKKWFCPSFHYMLEHQQSGWFGLCIVPIIYYLLTYMMGNYNYTDELWAETGALRILLMVLVFSVYNLFLQLFKRTRQQLTLQNEQNMLTLQINAMQTYLGQLKESQKKTAIYRHDLRHHMQYISACLNSDKIQDAQEYITSVCNDITAICVMRYCENDTINLLLSSYSTKAKESNITLDISVDVPAATQVPPTDICVIFANSLENAINATKPLSQEDKRKIDISCNNKNGKLFLQIKNNYTGSVKFNGDIPYSTKKNHGTGIKSIVSVVEKCQGVYSFTAKDGVFIMNVIL